MNFLQSWLTELNHDLTDNVKLLHQCRICSHPSCVRARLKDYPNPRQSATKEQLQLCGDFLPGGDV